MTIERSDIEFAGGRMAYWAAGVDDGEPVVLLHGYLGSHMSWRHQMSALAGAGYRVVAPDWFGWGQSTLADTATYEDDVARIGELADLLGFESFNLFGHDYGGFIGLGFAEDHPERVRRFAVLNSRAHRTFRPMWYAIFQSMSSMSSSMLGRMLLRLMPVRLVHRLFVRRERREGWISDAALASYTRRLDAQTLTHIFADYECEERPELAANLGRIACPAAVIWGAEDRFLDASVARELVEGMPDAQIELVGDAGHFIMEQRPQFVTDACLRLLAR